MTDNGAHIHVCDSFPDIRALHEGPIDTLLAGRRDARAVAFDSEARIIDIDDRELIPIFKNYDLVGSVDAKF